MKPLIVMTVGVLLLGGCKAEKKVEVSTSTAVTTTQASDATASAPTLTDAPTGIEATTTSADTTAGSENQQSGTWAGQVKVGQPGSMFHYVGAESGDFVPMRFDNASEAGKKILAACSNDDLCEFTGAVEWLDEPPPPDASAIGRIVRVDSAKRLPPNR